MKVPNRKEAIALGLKQYCNGVLCKNGNIAPRLVSTSACQCEPCNDERVEKTKAWRHANPDKAKRHTRQWKHQNPGVSIAPVGNPEKRRQKRLESGRAYYRENRDVKVAKQRAYYQVTRLAHQVWARLRLLKQRRAVPSWYGELDELVFREASRLRVLREKISGIEWNVDHIIPIACRTASGLHVWNNFQVIPAVINNAKKNKLILTEPGEWLYFCALTGSITKPLVMPPCTTSNET